MQGVDETFEHATALVIASENWSSQYDKTPEIHTKLIKTEARIERKLRKYFRDLAKEAPRFINWALYRQAIMAANVDVMVYDDILHQYGANTFISLMFDDISLATALGAQSGETLYKVALGLTPLDSTIQKIALENVAGLVGMKVTKDNQIIKNPKAELNILDTTRNDIRQSISSSIALGEDIQTASDRLSSVINNPARAELIARTETVNSFGDGLNEFGKQSGAVGHQWLDNDATDICATNADQGPIPFDEAFASGDYSPAAHPNCRCNKRLIYQNELDKNPDLFD